MSPQQKGGLRRASTATSASLGQPGPGQPGIYLTLPPSLISQGKDIKVSLRFSFQEEPDAHYHPTRKSSLKRRTIMFNDYATPSPLPVRKSSLKRAQMKKAASICPPAESQSFSSSASSEDTLCYRPKKPELECPSQSTSDTVSENSAKASIADQLEELLNGLEAGLHSLFVSTPGTPQQVNAKKRNRLSLFERRTSINRLRSLSLQRSASYSGSSKAGLLPPKPLRLDIPQF
ncbi:hypothetical protein BDR26DRAFT_1007556 [Obelidium mucronatum]|nr:hypothetical protein BDR26DRAFT_1007556 [Obelidium mucronatum]